MIFVEKQHETIIDTARELTKTDKNMIRKVQGNEYLKRYDNMTSVEREAYEDRVGQWLSDSSHMLAGKGDVFEARMQNVLQVSAAWNDRECQAFEEGARLLSALVGICDTWLPEMLYVKSARRAIRKMVESLWDIDGKAAAGTVEADKSGLIPKEERAEGTVKATHAVGGKPVSTFQGGAGNGAVGGANKNNKTITNSQEPVTVSQSLLVPVRPKHIDQYVHLLPRKVQEHAAQVQGLYRELDDAREKLRLLLDDVTASAADREAWAKKATKCDNTLRKIFGELDAEWAKLVQSGRVVVDDLGNARTLPRPLSESEGSDCTCSGETNYAPPLQGVDGDGSVGPLTSEQRARRRELRKWLTDTRRGNGAARGERVKKWYENFREYLTLEGDKAFDDEKIKEAIRHYDIDIKKIKVGK